MSKVTITLTDDAGQIACNAHFEDGFNRFSHAHQHAQILLKKMDELCGPKSGETVQTVDVPAVEAVQAQ
jgi:hypothetical protein